MISDESLPSIRDQIMNHLADRFDDVVSGVDGRVIKWSKVWRDPWSCTASLVGDANIAIIDGRETKSALVGYTMCTLQITTEFKVKVAKNDKKTSIVRNVMAEVQRTILSDIYCGGLALNIVERANEPNVDGENDTEVSGIVFWDLQYRHRVGDPCRLI